MLDLIIPTYKARDTLGRALDSLVAQTKEMFIVTIVQDCDDEDYTDIIEEYRRRGLHIRHLTTPENQGPGMARQLGLDTTSCDFVMFLDADDMLLPQSIEYMLREIQQTGMDILTSDLTAETGPITSRYIPCENSPVQWSAGKIYRVSYLRKNDIRFIPELRLNEDSYFNLVAFNGTEKNGRIAKETYLWCYNKNSLTRSEENGNYFHRSWDQYILSQVYGLKKLYSLGPINDGLVAATLLNIYNHTMKAIFYKEDLSKIDDTMYKLAHLEPMWEQLNKIEVWQYINANLRASSIENNSMYFFKMRFIDWIEGVKKLK